MKLNKVILEYIVKEELNKLNEEKYIVASIYGDLYTPKAVPEKQAKKLMMKIADQYAGDNVFMLGVKAWNKPHKYNKKKIKVKEEKLTEASGKWVVVNGNDTLNIFVVKVVNSEREAQKIAKDLKQKDKYGRYQAVSVKQWNKAGKGKKIKEGKLTEGTVRINTNTDAEFHSQGMALIGKKAKIGLDKKAMKSLLQIIKNKLGNSLACENTIDEAGAVLNNGIKIDVGFGGVTFFATNGQKIPLNRSELQRFVTAIHKQAKINCW